MMEIYVERIDKKHPKLMFHERSGEMRSSSCWSGNHGQCDNFYGGCECSHHKKDKKSK